MGPTLSESASLGANSSFSSLEFGGFRRPKGAPVAQYVKRWPTDLCCIVV